jgi:hypothetical protein
MKNIFDSLKGKFSQNKNVRGIIRIDLLEPEFESKYANYKEKFDTVFLLNVIEHIENDLLAVKNCRNLLKPNGHLILLAPAYSWLYSSFDQQLGHYRRYSLRGLKELLRKEEFSVLSGSYFNFTGIGGWLLFGKILNRKMLSSGEMAAFNKIVPIAKLVDKLVWKKSGLSIIVTGIKIKQCLLPCWHGFIYHSSADGNSFSRFTKNNKRRFSTASFSIICITGSMITIVAGILSLLIPLGEWWVQLL